MAVGSCSFISATGMSLLGRRFDVNHLVARIFYALVSRTLDIHIDVEGGENLDARPAILVCNHQSMLDVFIVGKLMPKQTAIMSKRSLQFTPLGPFMMMSGAIFIDRGNNTRAIRSLEAAAEVMRQLRVSLWMFPEGTRHSGEVPDLLPFKKGGFHLAIQSGLPIIPIVTENYWRLYRKGVFETGRIKVRVLPAIPTTGLTPADVPALITRVRDQMLAALREISVEVPSSGSTVIPRDLLKPTVSTREAVTPSPTPQAVISALHEANRGSSVSIASSTESSPSRIGMSDTGGETEEDEGMILVGRPAA